MIDPDVKQLVQVSLTPEQRAAGAHREYPDQWVGTLIPESGLDHRHERLVYVRFGRPFMVGGEEHPKTDRANGLMIPAWILIRPAA